MFIRNILISPSFLKDTYARYRILGWQYFSFVILNMSSHCLLASVVSDEKSAVNLAQSQDQPEVRTQGLLRRCFVFLFFFFFINICTALIPVHRPTLPHGLLESQKYVRAFQSPYINIIQDFSSEFFDYFIVCHNCYHCLRELQWWTINI